ncbi:MAG TPA: response regulator transcription factor [Gemmatimonadales bacterium]|nr:response regulator transcription factor [Gemmatimonadales bacterium]
MSSAIIFSASSDQTDRDQPLHVTAMARSSSDTEPEEVPARSPTPLLDLLRENSHTIEASQKASTQSSFEGNVHHCQVDDGRGRSVGAEGRLRAWSPSRRCPASLWTDVHRKRSYETFNVNVDHGRMRVLVAEDEEAIRDLLARGLTENGYVVDEAATGSDALHLLRIYRYSAAILDWRMPDMAGIDVVRAARRLGVDVPVLMVTARDALRDRVEGLDAGADDYLVKPFEFDELLARLRAVLRRPARGPIATFEIADLVIESATKRVLVGDREVDLSPKEFAILLLLMSQAPAAVPMREIAQQIWPDESRLVGSNTIHVHIGRIKKKIGRAKVRITTVRGQGFRVEASR